MFTNNPPPAPPGRVGSLVDGRYRIEALIGQGGVGAIYEVVQVATGLRLALKTLAPSIETIPDIRRRFEREAKATSRLNHPNIVEALDYGTLPDGALFMVMELVRGRSLGSAIDAGTMEQGRSLALTLQILEAVGHAHDLGIIHRDLKPDNVMLVGEGDQETVKLLDFGIAKLIGEAKVELGGEDLTIAGVAFGTPEYMAPEQAMGQVVDARADLYAVGIMLFEMLTGKRPFDSPDAMDTARRKVIFDPPRLAELAPEREFSPELETFMARAVARSPSDRFASAEEMRAALEPLVTASGPETAPEARPGQVAPAAGSRRSGRSARVVWIGLSILVALGIALFVIRSRRGGAPRQPPGVETSRPSLAGALASVVENGNAPDAIAALELLAEDGRADARAVIVAQASRGKRREVRRHAVVLAERLGLSAEVDWVDSHALELLQAPTCKERLQAVVALGKLGDKRALPALEGAIKSVKTGRGKAASANRCLEREASLAIERLEKLP